MDTQAIFEEREVTLYDKHYTFDKGLDEFTCPETKESDFTIEYCDNVGSASGQDGCYKKSYCEVYKANKR